MQAFPLGMAPAAQEKETISPQSEPRKVQARAPKERGACADEITGAPVVALPRFRFATNNH